MSRVRQGGGGDEPVVRFVKRPHSTDSDTSRSRTTRCAGETMDGLAFSVI